MLVSTILTSVAQVFYKFASETLAFDFVAIITNWYLIAGLFCYGVALILLVYALKLDELSRLFPLVSASYIWVTILAFYLFDESITFFNIVGIMCIVGGVILLSAGGKKK